MASAIEKLENGCDVRIWSGDCLRTDAPTLSEKYLCKVCGSLADTDHEVSHEFYSNVSGDYRNLS